MAWPNGWQIRLQRKLNLTEHAKIDLF